MHFDSPVFGEVTPTTLRRLNDIAKFPENDKICILYTIEAMINNVKLKGLNV